MKRYFHLFKSQEGWIKALVGAVILLALGGGVVLALRGGSPFRPKPEVVLSRAYQKMVGLKSWHVQSREEVKGVEGTSGDFVYNLDLSFDNRQPKSQKGEGSFDIRGESGKNSFSVKGEIKRIGEITYQKLTDLRSSQTSQSQEILLLAMKGRWFKFDPKKIKEFLKIFPAEQREKLEKEIGENEEYWKRLSGLMNNKNLYVVEKQLPDDKIGHKKAYHYLVRINTSQFKKEVSKLLSPMPELKGMDKLNQFFEEVSQAKGDLWIGKRDLYIYRIKIAKKIETSSGQKILLSIEVDYSKFNQPFQIKPPADSVGIEELIKEIIYLEKGGYKAKSPSSKP